MKTLAIIGSGISGMSAARLLHNKFDLSIYEQNDYIGGHTNTIEVFEKSKSIPIDTGFMVYNEQTYPLLSALFNELKVKTRFASMSFGVQDLSTGLEFSGAGLSGLFAQRKNVFRPQHWKLLLEIDRFNSTCEEVLREDYFSKMTLSDYCKHKGYSPSFYNCYLIPMSSAVWSSSHSSMLQFPIVTLVRFFSNHRFLGLRGQLTWKSVVGGSRVYRDKLIAPFRNRIHVNRRVINVRQSQDKVFVRDTDNRELEYDAAILACHADQAIQMIENPSATQKKLLSRWKYHKNTAVLHTDDSVMPQSKAAWAAWNYRREGDRTCTIYWINQLQEIDTKQNYFISINGRESLRSEKIIRVIEYEHPLYDLDAANSQTQLDALNKSGPIYFCGSYFGYGFHEDGFRSGMEVAASVIKGSL